MSALIAIVVVVLAVGSVMGWHANRTYSAHGDVKLTKSRIAAYRRRRLRSGLIAIAFIVAGVLVVASVASGR